MSKAVSFILVLVLFFGPAINGFADKTEEAPLVTELTIIVGVVLLSGLLILGLVELFKPIFAGAETPDNGIRMVSTEDEAHSVNTDDKTVLNVLKHVEAGVTTNRDIYIGLRFQY